MPEPLIPPADLRTLSDYLGDLDPQARARGQAYVAKHLVRDLRVDPDSGTYAAVVRGGIEYPVTLACDAEGFWTSTCSCPVGSDCKHVYALGATLVARQKALSTPGVTTANHLSSNSPRPTAVDSSATSAAAGPAPRRHTFREEWTPKLANRLGRDLTREEIHLLGELSALFHEIRQSGLVRFGQLLKHGFAPWSRRDPGSYDWQLVFEDWWPRAQPPADPWALWQFIAYDWERHNQPLPEAFVPLTDTSAVRARVEYITLQRELDPWRRLFTRVDVANATTAATPSVSPTAMEIAKASDFRLVIDSGTIAELQILPVKGKGWKTPTAKWLKALQNAPLAELESLPPAAGQLAIALRMACRNYHSLERERSSVDSDLVGAALDQPSAHPAIVFADDTPFRIEPTPLRLHARPVPGDRSRLQLSLLLPDGSPAPEKLDTFPHFTKPHYLIANRLYVGPPELPSRQLPVAALSDPSLATHLRALGVDLPADLASRYKTISLRPRLHLSTVTEKGAPDRLHARLVAYSDAPRAEQHWLGIGGWTWTVTPPSPLPEGPEFLFDLAAANVVGAGFRAFQFQWSSWDEAWARPVTRTFPEDFVAWRATLPPDTEIVVSPDLQGLLGAPLRARLAVSATPAKGSGQDWFDLHIEFRAEDLTLTPEEISLLLKARGQWVRLPSRGWQRLQVEHDEATLARLARLGLAPDDELVPGKRSSHRYHARQLADAALDDEALAARLRARAAELRAVPPPALPVGVNATLRPYQMDGYHFLAHLAAHGLGGVLADDMGLGKTLQTLAWLLHLASERDAERRGERERPDAAPLRVLVVCPKSVVPNWRNEAARFTPSLATATLSASDPADALPSAPILVLNYAQLRLRAEVLAARPWDVVILDEAQNIKNPASATARAACALPARHRLAVTGTPIENRLMDLWSLLHFAQPGLLGSRTSFQRLYNEKADPAGARSRLAARVRPFLLRRTKSQVAQDLPARIEEEISCELEGPQRTLYDAELKRARQLLLAVKTAREFDNQRFNILQSLLRLRQICCDPRLVGLDSADSPPPMAGSADDTIPPVGAKLEALLDTLEPLVAEGHRVLVFSQFVRMLELIREELVARDIGHLLLTGQTENRQALVDTFQSADGPPVFLLSLKAAGSGLNLTAASYVVLFDPWWNPAVEAQAIDRTHRIGQTNTVIAYRLIARDTVEEKIRALQREKSALAAAVVQEESLATVMDLESLRRILA